jgi:hypothetical protein
MEADAPEQRRREQRAQRVQQFPSSVAGRTGSSVHGDGILPPAGSN